MSKLYTLEDLVQRDKIYINKLTTNVLQEFYSTYLEPNIYRISLSNKDTINLVFDNTQFCHLAGLSYFGYEGESGWSTLVDKPQEIKNFSASPDFKVMQYRLLEFRHIKGLLESPDIFIYNADDYPQYSYKAKYFAVLKRNGRMLKLGIGIGNHNIHYPETFLVDLDRPDLNHYLKPEKLLTILKKEVINKSNLKRTGVNT